MEPGQLNVDGFHGSDSDAADDEKKEENSGEGEREIVK